MIIFPSGICNFVIYTDAVERGRQKKKKSNAYNSHIIWHRILKLRYAITTKGLSHKVIIRQVDFIYQHLKRYVSYSFMFLCASTDELLNVS